MTYEEISHELARLATNAGEHVRLVQGDLDATVVHLSPARCFIAMKILGRLNICGYEGPELRIVGRKDIAFEEVTPEFLQDEFNEGLAEQVAHMLDPAVLKKLGAKLPPSGGRGDWKGGLGEGR